MTEPLRTENADHVDLNSGQGRDNFIHFYDQRGLATSEFDSRSGLIFQQPNQDKKSWIDAHYIRAKGDREVFHQRMQQTESLDDLDHLSEIAFFLRHTSNSNSRLSPSKHLFDGLVGKYDISPRFQEFVMSFGFKRKEYDYAPPASKVRIYEDKTTRLDSSKDFISDQASILQKFECMYGFRYAANNGSSDPERRDPWSMRQTAVYQSYWPTRKRTIWVIIGASASVELLVDRYLAVSHQIALPYQFTLHAVMIEVSLAEWRWYLRDLTERVQKLSESATLSDLASTVQQDAVYIKVDARQRQKLRTLQDRILNLKIMLQSTVNTGQALRGYYLALADLQEPGLGNRDATLNLFIEAFQQASEHLEKAKILYKQVKGASTIMSDLITYENAYSLKALAEDAKQDNMAIRKLSEMATDDSRAIRIITIITVLFLPATVVSSFFSTQFVKVEANSFSLSSTTWVYFAVTISLTTLTILAWAWLPIALPKIQATIKSWWRQSRRRYPRSGMVEKRRDV